MFVAGSEEKRSVWWSSRLKKEAARIPKMMMPFQDLLQAAQSYIIQRNLSKSLPVKNSGSKVCPLRDEKLRKRENWMSMLCLFFSSTFVHIIEIVVKYTHPVSSKKFIFSRLIITEKFVYKDDVCLCFRFNFSFGGFFSIFGSENLQISRTSKGIII